MMRFARISVVLSLAVGAFGAPAYAQNDLSGEWLPVQEEDNTGTRLDRKSVV